MDSLIGRRSRARSESSVDAPHAALLIDFDNVTMGIRSDLQNQLRKLMNSDIIKGKVSVQRAYADWRRYPQYIVPLSEASIDLIFAPAFGANKKNATDIRLAIDALELVFTRPEIGTFILLSGDSDFSALVLKLKEYGKYVIGVGIRESSSDLLIQNCDEYFSYSELTGLAKESEIEHVRRDPWELVVEAVQKMLHEGDVMRSDRLKQVMQGIDPKFDEKDAGFNRFSKFVVSAAQRGLLSLRKMENGQYAIDLGANANVTVAEGASTEVAADASKPRKASTRGRDGRRRSESEAALGVLTLSESFDLLKQALVAAGATGDESTDHEQIRHRMIELHGSDSDPVFDARRFLRMLRQAHDAGLIELIKTDGDRYLLKLTAVATVGQPQAEATASVDKHESAATVRKKAAKKTKKTARRTTTRRSARSKTDTPLEGAVASPDSEPATTGPDQVDSAEVAEVTPGEERKTARRSRATPRRTQRDKVSTNGSDGGSETASSPPARPRSRAQSTRRSTRPMTRAAETLGDAAEVKSQAEAAAAESGASRKSAKRNPRYRRGSRGSIPRPDTAGTDAAEEPQSDEKLQTTSSSMPRTSGSRSLRMRRGSRSRRVTPQPEAAATGSGVPKPSEPSEAAAAGPAEVHIGVSEPEVTQPEGMFGQVGEPDEQRQGFLGKLRAAIHKAVGADPQGPDAEH
ncbi:MAG: NYN domain-containing protein [Gemmatimonadota bacterium]|nr:MAG: NYN domain-containing protein [Gemmatimonadota bacterium]